MVVFFWVVILAAWPPGTSAHERPENAPSESAGVATKATADSGSFEKETAPAKKKKFPWLLAAAGTAAIGVAVYFLVIKKPSYKLTVEIASSVTGNPGSGVYTYKKGKNVNYNFNPLQGYESLKVLLDGKEIPASGSIRMDQDHVLKATAQEITYTLKVSTGAGVKGSPAAGSFTYRWHESVAYAYSVDEGYQNLKVLLDGSVVPNQGTIVMDGEHSLSAAAEVKPPPPPPSPPPISETAVLGSWNITIFYDKTSYSSKCTFHFEILPNNSHKITWDLTGNSFPLYAQPGPCSPSDSWSVNSATIYFDSPYVGYPFFSNKQHLGYMGATSYYQYTGSFSGPNSMSGTWMQVICGDMPPWIGRHVLYGGTWTATRK